MIYFRGEVVDTAESWKIFWHGWKQTWVLKPLSIAFGDLCIPFLVQTLLIEGP